MSATEKWLDRLNLIIEKHIDDPDFNNEILAEAIAISERHLFRRVKEITGLSPQKYLRRYRLHLAMTYLREGTFRTVNETAKAVGYIKTSYFIHQFEKEYGLRPFRVLKDAGWR